MLQTIVDIAVYYVIGLALFIAGYYAINLLGGIKLSEEIKERHNKAAGIAVAGLFIGIAIAVSAAIR